MITIAQMEKLDGIAVAWGLYFSTVEIGVPKRLASAEALLHEICHGLALGYRKIEPKLPDRVSRHFDKVNEVSPILGLVLEAQAFAIEYAAIDVLKWHQRPMIKTCLRRVWSSGLSGPAIPWPMFLSTYRRFRKEPGTRALAIQAARRFRKLIDPR